MEHRQAQRRMLICAAFFSFGTICGALTFLDLPFSASEHIWRTVTNFFSIRPLFLIPAAFSIGPLILLFLGFSAAGLAVSDLVLILFGFTAGFASSAVVRFSRHCFCSSAFLLIPCVCLVMTGACLRRTSYLVRAQIRSGGLLRPDYGYDALRIGSFFCILLLAALAFSYYLLSL